MVFLFNKTIKNIFSNFIPQVTSDERDPPWINSNIRQLIQEKNNTYRSYILNDKNLRIFHKVKYLQKQLRRLIGHNQEKRYIRISRKLMDPMTSLKTYWSLLKTLLNNKKIPCIPPLLQDNKYVTDFKKKAELFNLFFAKQCSIIDNSSELPSNFLKKTDKSIFAITFTCNDIATLIKNLDPNKAHDHDMISICMLKLCGKSICKPLDLIFQSCMKQGKFHTKWRKANVVPVHKKGDKQI